MKLAFEVDVPFEIPTLRFVLERDHRFDKGGLRLSCYFDKGREMYGLALRLKTIDDTGRCAQLLALAASWTVEALERWPRDEETGKLTGDMAELDVFLGSSKAWDRGRPLFAVTSQGDMAMLDEEKSWERFL